MFNPFLRWSHFLIVALLAISLNAPAPLGPAPLQARGEAQALQAANTVYLPFVLSNFFSTTSNQLIQSALERGEIDYFTSLLYRFYAQFGDDRLPAHLSGIGQEDLAVFQEARDLLPTLSAGQQAQLNAFLVFPDDPASAWSQDQSQAQGAPAGTGAAAAAPCWVGKKSLISGLNVKVWAACDDGLADADIALTLGLMSDLWGPMTALMGQPLPDAGGAGSGGSTDIDIYLLNPLDLAPRDDPIQQVDSGAGAVAPATKLGVSTSSGYMLMRRDSIDQVDNFKATLAHEFFHVLQHAHNYRVHFNQNNEEWWFTEASAKWAEVHFVPEYRKSSHSPFKQDFQSSEVSLNLREPGSSENHSLLYAGYIWPFFMEMELGEDSIAQAWDKIALVGPDQDAADLQINNTLSFDLHFHRFAVRNLNMLLEQGDPVSPRYVTFDADFPDGARPLMSSTVMAAGESYSSSKDLPRLKAHYYEVLFDDLSVKSAEVRLAPGSSLDLDLLIRKKGVWSLQNFSGQTKISLCDVEKMYVVVSNPAFAINNHIPYSLDIDALETPCSCTVPKVPAFNGSVSFDYSFAAANGEYSYTLDQHASGVATATLAVDEQYGRSYQGIVTGTGSVNDHKVRAGNPPLADEAVASGPLVPSVNPELLSYAALNFDLTNCRYNAYFSADVPHGNYTMLVGVGHTGWMPIPENLVLSGSRMIDARSESWAMPQHTLPFFYSLGGFGDSIFYDVIGLDNPAGQALYTWNFSPAP